MLKKMRNSRTHLQCGEASHAIISAVVMMGKRGT